MFLYYIKHYMSSERQKTIADILKEGDKIVGPPKKMEKKNAKQLGLTLNVGDDNNDDNNDDNKESFSRSLLDRQPIEPKISRVEEGPSDEDKEEFYAQRRVIKEHQAGGKKKTKKRKSSKKKTKKRKGKRKSGKKK